MQKCIKVTEKNLHFMLPSEVFIVCLSRRSEHFRNEEAIVMETQIWEDLFFFLIRPSMGLLFFHNIFSNLLPRLTFFYKKDFSNVLVISQKIKILVNVNTSN